MMTYHVPIKCAQKNLDQLADLAIHKSAVVNIQIKNGNVIMVSEHDYRGLIETLYINNNQTLKDSIIEGRNTPLSNTLDEEDIDWS